MFRIRRTLGQGPPSELGFGELAFSNEDQRLHVGRPAPAPPASFEARFTQITRPILPQNDFVFIEGWANELIVIGPKLALIQFGVTRPTAPANITTMLTWTDYPAVSGGIRTGHCASSAGGFVYVSGSSLSLVPGGQGSNHFWVGSVLFPLQ